MNPDTTQNPDRLPPRDLPRRRSGRHRNPLSFDSAIGTPELVLAVPGAAEADPLGRQMADLVRAYRPEVEIRFGYAEGEQHRLGDVLAGLEAHEGRAVRAVIVPLVTAPHAPTLKAIDDAVAATGADVRVSEGLGPHPMLAEVLHLRLAEAGFVRADRMRLISVVAAGTGMADGVVVGSAGGSEALGAAGVTAVLLAARLGVTVLPAAMDDPDHIKEVFGQLRDAGCVSPVLAPSVIGAEFPAEAVTELAQQHGARACAPLGTNSTIAKIVALRYAEILNSLGIEEPPTLEELPAPVGSRHRPES
ncbi:sirohydrochlorin chelatase [Marinactinospora thermotolerans]|uniref:CbiX protein n=1 Tax=Marinactinospora thermotolerans DSM 45154 TaxID=1122192 RepID=A0A1T4SJA6_9ACTN|nr:CbiX/SirB N-terminal domain-containing protein [Marinactinospora thermotolerans]SKA28384.1 CbiX protein [Marinactinospora thermotolerans DSM 45154]